MAPDPLCTAVNAAKNRTGLSYGQIAARSNMTEQQVIDICTSKQRPTQDQFNTIANVLGITQQPPHDKSHATA